MWCEGESEGEGTVVADGHAKEGCPALVEELLVRATHALAQLGLAPVGDVPVIGVEGEAGNGGRDNWKWEKCMGRVGSGCGMGGWVDTLELGDDTLGPEVSERRITLIALGALLRLQLAPVEDERAATRLCSIVEPWTVRLVCSARYPITHYMPLASVKRR